MDLDLFDYCVWDDEDGTTINRFGMEILMSAVAKECVDGWVYHACRIPEHDETLFLLHFSKEEL